MLPPLCDNPVAPCCDCVYQTVRDLVDAAADGVMDCIGASCKEFNRYVTTARPTDYGDFVCAWTGVTTPNSTPAAGDKQLTFPKLMTPITIRLCEGGYPTMDMTASRITKPSADAHDNASRYFYAHAEAALRAMINTRASLNPCQRGCERVQFISHQSFGPESGYVFWEFNWRLVHRL